MHYLLLHTSTKFLIELKQMQKITNHNKFSNQFRSVLISSITIFYAFQFKKKNKKDKFRDFLLFLEFFCVLMDLNFWKMICESFCDYKSEKFVMVIDQGCPNHTFEGVFLHPDLRYFLLKYDSDIWHTGWGGQSRPSEFFWGQGLFWWLQNGVPKQKLYT